MVTHLRGDQLFGSSDREMWQNVPVHDPESQL